MVQVAGKADFFMKNGFVAIPQVFEGQELDRLRQVSSRGNSSILHPFEVQETSVHQIL